MHGQAGGRHGHGRTAVGGVLERSHRRAICVQDADRRRCLGSVPVQRGNRAFLRHPGDRRARGGHLLDQALPLDHVSRGSIRRSVNLEELVIFGGDLQQKRKVV